MAIQSAIRPHIVNRFGKDTVLEIPNTVKPNLLCYYIGSKTYGWDNVTDKKWFDSSGNNRHADMYNLAYTGTSDLNAYGFNCDGVDDYGSIADSVDTRLAQGGTLMAWIKPRTYGESAGKIFDKSTAAVGADGYSLYLASNAGVNSLVFNANNTASTVSIGNAVIYNKWQLVSVDFSSLGRHICINGVDATFSNGAITLLPPDVAGTVCIGNRANATDRTFDGQIDRAGICNRALTQYEIYQIYQATRRFYT